MAEQFFVHSKCCMAHWELVVEDGKYSLQCENCGKPIGPSVKITGPTDVSCELCEEDKETLERRLRCCEVGFPEDKDPI